MSAAEAFLREQQLDGTPTGLFRWAGCLPPRHEDARELVATLQQTVPNTALAGAWARAFEDFLIATTDSERHAARMNLLALHAAAFRVPPSLLK